MALEGIGKIRAKAIVNALNSESARKGKSPTPGDMKANRQSPTEVVRWEYQ